MSNVHEIINYRTKLSCKNRIYHLTEPLKLQISKMDEYFIIHNALLGIETGGSTIQEAVENFIEDFDFAYQNCALVADDKLKQVAIEHKKKLLATVDHIESVGEADG